jgi:hypothetical protein
MRKLLYSLSLIIIVIYTTGCASLMKIKENGTLKVTLNVVTNEKYKEAKILIDNKECVNKLIYDGSKTQSPFYVYLYELPKPENSFEVSVKYQNIEKKVTIKREREKGWFWVSGLWIFADEAVGSLYYYQDVVVPEILNN